MSSLWSFNPPAFLPPLPRPPPSSRTCNPLQLFNILPFSLGAHLLLLAAVHQFPIPFFASHIPNTFCTISGLLPVCPFFYQAVEAGRVLQSCVQLLPFLLHSFRSCFCHKPCVQQRSFFCQLIGLLIAFGDELLKNATYLSFPSSYDVLSHVALPPKCPFCQIMQFFPNFDPKIGISRCWHDALSFSSP